MLAPPPGSVGHGPKGRPKSTYYACGWNVRPACAARQVHQVAHRFAAGSSTLLVCRDDRINWAVLFNSDAGKDGKQFAGLIDPLLHKPANEIKDWPEIDLFPAVWNCMNYFAHALPFLADPYFMAGTGVPHWLAVVDRGVRVRAKNVEPLTTHPDGVTVAVAGGLLQHLRDDAQFHKTQAFAETTLELSAAARRVLADDSSFRPSFLAHLLVEVLLDWTLAEDNPGGLDSYYRALQAVDPGVVQEAVNRMATRGTDRLAPMILLFCRERILWDYGEDGKLLLRMNQVMRRVGFPLCQRGCRSCSLPPGSWSAVASMSCWKVYRQGRVGQAPQRAPAHRD